MIIIRKFRAELRVDDHGPYDFELPQGSKPVHLGIQDGVIRLWAEVDESRETRRVTRYRLVPDGHEVDGEYVGTVICPQSGAWHLYPTFGPQS